MTQVSARLLGEPVLITGRGDKPEAHPLLKALNDLDKLCERLEVALTRRERAGRPPGAASAADRTEPPRVSKLRPVS